MNSQRNPQQLLFEPRVEIRFEDLAPAIQEAIHEIRSKRYARVLNEMGVVMCIAAIIATNDARHWKVITGTALGTAGRIGIAQFVQKEHRKIEKRNELIHSYAENKYPHNWIHIAEIARTHPIFIVKGNGDLVVMKSNRTEYYRYLFQQSKMGKLGLNAWRWRGYLVPPAAPESVKKWARDKLRRTMEKVKEELKPRRVPKPAMVSARMREAFLRARKNRSVHHR